MSNSSEVKLKQKQHVGLPMIRSSGWVRTTAFSSSAVVMMSRA
jgi:hypothetical protein